MSGPSADCGCRNNAAREQTCLSCETPTFCRNHYYRGKLLTERDFADEQRYGIDKMRLHTRALHGWGVACGLLVKPHPHCPELRLIVEPGFAIDDCGREIRLLKDDDVFLPKPPKKDARQSAAPAQPTRPHTPEDDRRREDDRYGTELDGGYGHGRRDPDDDEEVPLPSNPCDDTPQPKDYYLCISYAECETEFAPAPFDDCSCATSSHKPNRVCEGYRLELLDHRPGDWDKVMHEGCDSADCAEYYRMARAHCHGKSEVTCLPLAVIHNVVPGEPVTVDQIDNWGPRRQLASTETLDRVIRCILEKLPTEELTRVEDTNWEHGRRMLCREFMEEYVGTHDRPRGFRIEFSRKVHSHAIDTRSFQALVVFRPDSMSEPRHMETAPAYVEKDMDETEWCRLRIDPGYAKRHLDGRNFDLFLTLKCDVITDQHGHAVDGNFVGRHLPTGNNIQGGTFESWVRVRPRPRTV